MFRGFYHVQWVGGPDLMACLLRESSPWSFRCCCKLNWKSSFRFFFTYVWRQTFTFSVRGTGCGLYSLLTTSSPAGSKDVYILFTPSLSHADPECPLPSPPYLGFRVPVRRLDPCGPTNVSVQSLAMLIMVFLLESHHWLLVGHAYTVDYWLLDLVLISISGFIHHAWQCGMMLLVDPWVIDCD